MHEVQSTAASDVSEDIHDDDSSYYDDDDSEYGSGETGETRIETISPEDEMDAAEGDDDLTDSEFLSEDEWKEVVNNVRFHQSNVEMMTTEMTALTRPTI